MRPSLCGEKVSHTTLTLKDRYDANNDRNEVFNRPRVKGPDNRPKTCSTSITASVLESAFGRLTIADGEDTFSFEGLKQALRHTSLSLTHRSGQMSRSEVSREWGGLHGRILGN